MNEWDKEMFEMKKKLLSFVNDNYVWYDVKVRDYVSSPKSEGVPENYLRWKERHKQQENQNHYFKQRQNIEEKRAKNKNKPKPKPEPKTLVCEWCGYTFTSVYTGAFKQHHGDRCKKKPTNQKENK